MNNMHGLLDTSMIDTSFIWPTLQKAGYTKNEDSLLKAIIDDKSKKIVYYAVIGLWEFGTQKCVPYLKKLSSYPYRDVQTTSVVTVGKIAQAKETKYFADLLDDPQYKDKMYPMTVLWEIGNEDALPAVKRFAQNIIDKKIKAFADTIDPRYIRDYLVRYKDPEVEALLNQLAIPA
jgi:hypothetical protein